MEENDLLPVEKGLASKIYGLAFRDPQSGYSLAQQIGTQPHHVNAKIKELNEQKYLLKKEKKGWKYPRWQSNPEILVKKIEQIKQKDNIKLTELDKKVLSERFNNYLFRSICYNTFQAELKENPNANAIDYILSAFEIFTILMQQFSGFSENCQKIITEEDYQRIIQKERAFVADLNADLKLKDFLDTMKDEDIPKFHQHLRDDLGEKIEFNELKNIIKNYRESEQFKIINPDTMKKLQEQVGDETDIYNEMMTSIVIPIPKHLFENYRGISSWGRKYLELEGMIEMIMRAKFIDISISIDKNKVGEIL
jgi:hypothetical protein